MYLQACSDFEMCHVLKCANKRTEIFHVGLIHSALYLSKLDMVFFLEFAGAKICFLQYQQTFKSLYKDPFVKRNSPQVQVCVFASLKKKKSNFMGLKCCW